MANERQITIEKLTCTIRQLKPDDVQSLTSVKSSLLVHQSRFDLQFSGKACYLGAIVNNCIVGFVLLSLQDKKDVHPFTGKKFCADLTDLFVLEPLRGTGIGSALISHAEGICIQRGIEFIGLDVNPELNSRALALYKRLGYRPIGELHLDGVYRSVDENGKETVFEDWCIDMIKCLRGN